MEGRGGEQRGQQKMDLKTHIFFDVYSQLLKNYATASRKLIHRQKYQTHAEKRLSYLTCSARNNTDIFSKWITLVMRYVRKNEITTVAAVRLCSLNFYLRKWKNSHFYVRWSFVLHLFSRIQQLRKNPTFWFSNHHQFKTKCLFPRSCLQKY